MPEPKEFYINRYKLEKHPEGGYFSQFFCSTDEVTPNADRYATESRSAGTSIYYLLAGKEFSAWHRLKSDEVWHQYDGNIIKIHLLNKTGALETKTLGNPSKDESANFQVLIPAGVWFAAELEDKSDAAFALVGCTVTPGFIYQDFELAEKSLAEQYPQHKEIIYRLLAPSVTAKHQKAEQAEEKNGESESFCFRFS